MRIALGLLTVACSVMVLHCSAGLPYVCHGAIECGLEPDGGFEGGPDARPDVVPSGCDPAAAPKDAPACVANSFAVFVDGTAGADTNEGTKESPLKSIGVALTKLGSRSRVYVCEGTYAESVEITKLSLWLKTAKKGRPLESLDLNIRCGNSLIEDSDFHARAFVWDRDFPGGLFDIVIGNPPYVRMELLKAI